MFRAVTLHRMLKLAAAPIALGVLSACGGGGGGGVGVADGGIRGTGSSVGPVSGFGSVFVNGVKFETDGRVSSDDGGTGCAGRRGRGGPIDLLRVPRHHV